MRRALLIALLLLVATPALAVKKIIIVGDSIAWSGGLFPGLVYLRSRYAIDTSLRSLLKKVPGGNAYLNATVEDWGVSASAPTDWLSTPDSFLCSTQGANYPQLKAACDAGDGIINHITTGADVVVMIADDDTPTTASAAVDTLVTLRNALDAIEGTVLLSPPPHGPSSGNVALPADTRRALRVAVRDEMNGRGIITGPDFTTDLPMTIDGIHFRDQGYATMASLVIGFLP